jgi:hypothetical protein
LQNQRHEVTSHEKAGNKPWRQPGEIVSIDGNPCQAEVNGGREERGTYGEPDKVDDEVVVVEVVDVQLDTSSIANYLQAGASDHRDEVTPCAIANTETYLRKEGYGKDREVEGIAGKRGNIT